MTPQDIAKNAAAKKASKCVENGQTIGLGTGSTANFFIDHLSDRVKNEGLLIKAVATSKKSSERALKGGISLIEPNEMTKIDLCVDGADEIDKELRMIKGGGGALLREKIIASSASKMIVIVDESKLVTHLGKFPLSLEILPFGHNATLYKLLNKGFDAHFRKNRDGSHFYTDNQNLIIDIHFSSPLLHPEKIDEELKKIPGVLETGFFFHLAKQVIVGYPDGDVKIF